MVAGCKFTEVVMKDILDSVFMRSDRHGGISIKIWAGLSVDERTELVHVQGILNALRYRDDILELHVIPKN